MSTQQRRRDRRTRHERPPTPRKRRPLAAVLFAGVIIPAVVVVFGIQTWQRQQASDQPLNILLITLDTTRADFIGCFGDEDAHTPNLDALAAAGTRFTRCETCSPITLPSHASILTGLYPYVHGARINGVGRLAAANSTLAERLKTAGYRTRATVASFVLNARFGIDQGFDVYHDVNPGTTGVPLAAERRGDDICNDAIDMLAQVADNQFFLWVHFYDPHFPYESPDSSNPSDIESRAAYAEEVTYMDKQIGRLIAQLESHELEENTLIVIVGDHGEGLGDHNELTHGLFVYETCMHVPFIMVCPERLPIGHTVKSLVRTIDIAPTILDLLGKEPWPHAQGVTLVPLIRGEIEDLDIDSYGESFVAHNEYGVSPLRCWFDGQYKYIHAPQPELYDLRTDPMEQVNLIQEQAELAASLTADLRQLIADAPPPMVDVAGDTSLDEAARSKLESLGYVAAGGTQVDEDVPEIERFEPEGANPMDHAQYYIWNMRDVPLLREQNKLAEAEAKLREIVNALPQAGQVRVELANILAAQDKLAEATEVMRAATEVAPDDHTVFRKYGLFLAKQGRFREALGQFGRALELVPTDTSALEQAALAWLELGDYPRARQHLERIHEIEPENIRAPRNLGLLSEQKGALAEARYYYETALRIDPTLQACQAGLQRIRQRTGG